MENLMELLGLVNPVLLALVLGGTEAFKKMFKNIDAKIITIVTTVLFGGAYYLLVDGAVLIDIVMTFLTAIGGYDFVLKPILKKKAEAEKEEEVK